MPLDQRFIEQAQAYIKEAVRQENPSVSVDGGSAVNMIFARGASAILAPLLQQIEETSARRDLSNPDLLSDADLRLLITNQLAAVDEGEFSRGFINAYYTTRTKRTIPQGYRVTNEDGTLGFVVRSELVFDTQDHLLDQETGEYYLKIPIVAEDVGDEYDVDVGEISKTANDTTGVNRIVNTSKFRGGIAASTPAQIIARASSAASVRTIETQDGAKFAVETLLGAKLLDILVVGNGDPEMNRDELFDMGESSTPRFQIGRESEGGTALGVHVGGREDIYTWFRNVNLVQEVVDLFADMAVSTSASVGVDSLSAAFVPGTTGTVADDGKLVLDAGTASEETVRYSSFVLNGSTYTFTLESDTAFAHAAGSAVRVSNNSSIRISDDGQITLRPIVRIFEVRLLDPVTFEPIGDEVPETTADSPIPGWHITGRHSADSFSAKEEGYLVIDEKRDSAGNPVLSSTDGVTSVNGEDFTELYSPSKKFTGYQTREVTITIAGEDFTRNIIEIKNNGNTAVLDGDSSEIADGSSRTFEIAERVGNYAQFPVRITYYTHTEIQELQALLSGTDQRVVTMNTLARGFLPVFLDFKIRYRGDGSTTDVRAKLLELIQASAGNVIGQGSTAQFDYSDLIDAAYGDGLANYVETPFQVRATYMNPDGTKTVKYINPGKDTVNQLAVAANSVDGDTFLKTTRPASIASFAIPPTGKLRIGGFLVVPNVVVEYTRVIESGDDQTFLFKEGSSIDAGRLVGEAVTVHTLDYDPDLVIADGTITSERSQRPYFGEVVIEKIEA